jgi:hypothetical protein
MLEGSTSKFVIRAAEIGSTGRTIDFGLRRQDHLDRRSVGPTE